MTLEQALIDAELDKILMRVVCHPNYQLVVKRYDHHPCDLPVGRVVRIRCSHTEETYEILIS